MQALHLREELHPFHVGDFQIGEHDVGRLLAQVRQRLLAAARKLGAEVARRFEQLANQLPIPGRVVHHKDYGHRAVPLFRFAAFHAAIACAGKQIWMLVMNYRHSAAYPTLIIVYGEGKVATKIPHFVWFLMP
jgi:hypothetical protein